MRAPTIHQWKNLGNEVLFSLSIALIVGACVHAWETYDRAHRAVQISTVRPAGSPAVPDSLGNASVSLTPPTQGSTAP